jgi:hypothetical protein
MYCLLPTATLRLAQGKPPTVTATVTATVTVTVTITATSYKLPYSS